MPNCNAIVISSGLYIYPKFRGQHYAKYFQELRYELAKKLGFQKIISTIDMTNIPQVVSCTKFGWKFIETFRNEHTGNTLSLIEKEIN